MKPLKLLISTVIILLFAACSSSKITSSWKAPEAAIKSYNKIMVVGIIREADRTIREKMENHLVDDLKALGYNAYSSYKEFGPKAFENLKEDDIYEKVRESGADGVLTIVLLNKEKERYYAPRGVAYSPYFVYYNRFGGYYTTLYNRIYQPDYYTVSTKYFWESNFYDLSAKQLLYSVQTQSFDPSSSESLGHEYGKLIVQNMVNNNILANQSSTGKKSM